MNLIIPMAGRGKRLRPHTLTVPKPLIPIAGKPIVERLVEDIAKVCDNRIAKIGFVIGDFGEEVEQSLLKVAKHVGAEGRIFYQDKALGTAHAIYCAQELLDGPAVIAFADTLFRADFILDQDKDSIIWVQSVEDPSAFGVVKLNHQGEITDFVEKPKEFISDLAIIGIYYFKKSEELKSQIKYLLDNKIMKSGEYQLTDALENLKNEGLTFFPGQVQDWLDCGNKQAVIDSNARYLSFIQEEQLISPEAILENSVVLEPVVIGAGAKVVNSVIGPNVSIGENSVIQNSLISNSVIQQNSKITQSNISNSLVGNFVVYEKTPSTLSLGDYSVCVD